MLNNELPRPWFKNLNLTINFKKYFRAQIILPALIAGMVGGVLGLWLLPALRLPIQKIFTAQPAAVQPSGLVTPPPVLKQDQGLAEDEQTVSVVERARSSVVAIAITKDLSKLKNSMDPFFDQFFPSDSSSPDGKQKIGGGSGFLVSADGLIITNKHMVSDEEAEYTVILPSGKKFPAKVLARDPVLDLAVIDIEGDGYAYLSFGDSEALRVGQTVIAIGNALDEFPNTVTKGVVSGLNRRITAQDGAGLVVLEEAIQTDAAINNGNSGGPLIDLYGRVVGVNSATSNAGQLIGFALPGNAAKRDLEQVIKIGKITRPFLGIRYLIIDEDLIAKNQLSVDHGVLIYRGAEPSDLAVIPGSPADKAGLQENDIILELNGALINQEHSLSSLISHYLPGDTVTLKIVRRAQEQEMQVTLEEYKTTE
jgi:serine protease Do